MQNGFARGPREDQCLPNPISEESFRSPLHEAAGTGQEKTLVDLLAAGADRNAKDAKHGNTPLHEAAWRGYSRCVKALCALPKLPKCSKEIKPESKQLKGVLFDTRGALHSALLGTRNYGGFSPLHLAAQNGHNQSCREILLAGADPDVQNNYGDTPLHTACRYGHAGATRILLSGKCDPQRVNLNGDSSLHIACAMGRRKLTRILLEADASLTLRNAQEETARDIAMRKDLREIVDILDGAPRRSDKKTADTAATGGSAAAPAAATATAAANGVDNKKRLSTSAAAAAAAAAGAETKTKTKIKDHHKNGGEKSTAKRDRDRSSSADKSTSRKDKSSPSVAADDDGIKYDAHPKNWSPYGCHYYPDPRNFPKPKLETLPPEPLEKGEQYYLDLAGNIRKGPIGVGNTCYCGPFFRHIEEKIIRNRKSIRKYVDRAAEKLDSKVQALALKTEDQIGELTRSMITERMRCDGRRLHLEQWLKRGGLSRSSLATAAAVGVGASSASPSHHRNSSRINSKSKKDAANASTLTRCKSLELLDGCAPDDLGFGEGASGGGRISEHQLTSMASMSRSADLLDTGDQDAHTNRHSATPTTTSATASDDRRTSGHRHSTTTDSNRLDDLSSDSHHHHHHRPHYALHTSHHTHLGRIDALLAKTSEIVELDRRAARHHRRHHPGHHASHAPDDFDDDGEFIAEEMKKITASILRDERTPPLAPVSPEIAKEVAGPKEGTSTDVCVPDLQRHEFTRDGIGIDEMTTSFLEAPKTMTLRSSGYYRNVCFDLSPPAIEPAPVVVREEDGGESVAEMANSRELNELKSRILNGAHWRSQVLRKSAQEAELGEVANGNIGNGDSTSPSGSRVQAIVARLQGDAESVAPSPPALPPPDEEDKDGGDKDGDDNDDGASESSEDEEPDMTEASEETLLNDKWKETREEGEGDEQNDDRPDESAYPIYPSSCGISYGTGYQMQQQQQQPPQQQYQRPSYYPTRPPSGASPFRLDPHYLIPKDAYFHDLPHKGRCAAAAAATGLTVAPIEPRNRAPLSVGVPAQGLETDLYFQPHYHHQHPDVLPETAIAAVNSSSTPYIMHREKLLAQRKFGAGIVAAPSPAASSVTSLVMDCEHVAAGRPAAVHHNGQMSIEQAQFEREMHNDSGYSTKICGSSHGPSPSLSGQLDCNVNGSAGVAPRTSIGAEFYQASSLV